MDGNYDVINFFENTFILRIPRIPSFADLIQIYSNIKTTLKDSKEVKRVTNYVLKCNICLYILI